MPSSSDAAARPLRVLIYEPDPTGHHMADLSRLLPAIQGLPVEIVLATVPETLTSESYLKMVAPILDNIRVETCCVSATGSVLAVNWHQLRECAAVVKRFQPDHLYLMMGDGKWQLLSALRLLGIQTFPNSMTADTYLIRGGFAYPNAVNFTNRIKRWLFKRLLKKGPFDGVLLLDELAADYAAQLAISNARGHAILSPVPMTPHDSLTKHKARRQLGLPESGRLIAMMGMIDKLRGAGRVLEAFDYYSKHQAQEDDRLIIAGPHAENVLDLLKSPTYAALLDKQRLLSINRYLNDEELFAVAAAGDLLTMGTHQHAGRSSTLVWATANGRPVVATETGCIGHVIRSEQLGKTCDVTNPVALSQAWADVLNGGWTEADAGHARVYSGFHHIDNYRRIGTMTLRRRLGLR